MEASEKVLARVSQRELFRVALFYVLSSLCNDPFCESAYKMAVSIDNTGPNGYGEKLSWAKMVLGQRDQSPVGSF